MPMNYTVEQYTELRRCALQLIWIHQMNDIPKDVCIDRIRRPGVPEQVYLDLRAMMDEDIDEF